MSARVDPQTRTYEVRGLVEDPSGLAKAGSYTRAEVSAKRPEPRPVVHRSSLLTRDGRSYVMRVDGDVVRRTQVRVGIRAGQQVEILQGVAAGDLVVRGNDTSRISDGTQVRLREPVRAAPERGAAVNLSDVSVRRPVFAAMLILGLVVIGLISMTRLEMKLEPNIDFPFLSVVTELRGASPETVEREVTDLIEEAVNSIEGIHTMSSVSSQGLSRVSVQFEIGHDVDVKAQEVRDKVALARPNLPLDIEDPLVQKWDIDAISFMTIVLGGVADIREISDIAEHDVKERLERIGGVGSVQILGSREREVRVWLDPLRLTGYGLSIEDVANTLRRENAELASGRIEGAETEWSVTTQGKARTVDEFGEIIVAERAGRLVHLRDVAVVEDGMAEARSVARLNGNPGVAIELKQQSGTDLVAAAQDVRAEIAAIQTSLPPDIEIKVSRDYAQIVEDQVSSVLFGMVLAAALVVAVVLIFLRNFRSTVISGLAIPASVIATFTFFLITGLSLNNMTLMALTLAIGLVIDDAIVVLESIFRKVEEGRSPIDAALEGSREVGLAVVSTTLAVCGVFVPIFFMTSTMGRYFFEFGVTVVVAVLVSTLVAFTLTPSLASRVLSRDVKKEGAVFQWLERMLVAMEDGYRALLRWALRRKLATSLLAVVAIAGGCGVMTTVPVNYFTKDDLGEAAVRIKLPVGTPLSATERVLRRVEAELHEHPHVRDTLATAGDTIKHEPHKGMIAVYMTKKQDREGNGEGALRGATRARGSHGARHCDLLGGTPRLRRRERRRVHRDPVRHPGPQPGSAREHVERAGRAHEGRPTLRRRAHFLRDGQAADHPRRGPRAGGRSRRLLGPARAHPAYAPGRREGRLLRGPGEPLRRARAGPARVSGRSLQARPRAFALPDGRARSDRRRRRPAHRGGTGRGAAPRAQPAHRGGGEHERGDLAGRSGADLRGLDRRTRDRAPLLAGAIGPGRVDDRGDDGHRLRPGARHALDLHDPGVALQFPDAPHRDHGFGATLLHRRVPRAEGRGALVRHHERHGAPRPDGPGDEERHPAGGLHASTARAGPNETRGDPRSGPRCACGPCS